MVKSNEYWAERFKSLEQISNGYGTSTYANIEKAFIRAQSELQGKIDTWINRIAINNKVSVTEARKLLNTKELEEFMWDVDDYIKYGKENAINGQWIKELENASARVHISRYEAMQIRIQQQLEVVFGNQLDEIDDMARNVFTDSYYRSSFEIHLGINVAWDIAALDTVRINNIIQKPWAYDGRNFSSRIWINKTAMINELQSELLRTAILGSAPDAAIKRMATFVNKRFKNAKSQAGRLVMTEQAYFASVGQKQAFNDLDVEKYEILATLDLKTSEICQSLDGHVYEMKIFETGVTAPPFHPWCRTTTVPYFDDEFTEDEMRAARDKEGKTHYVSANLTYKDWYKEYVKA